MHVVMRARAQMIGIGHRILHEPHGRGLLLAQSPFEAFCHVVEFSDLLGSGDFLVDHGEEGLDRLAAVRRQLAPAQVHRLHAIGAFVDHGDAAIAHELFHTPLAHIAVAAIDLLHVVGDVIALVGAVTLDHRGHQPDQHIGGLALLGGLRLVGEVHLQRAPQAQRPHAFGEHLGIHQHPAHVGVDEDRIGLGLGLGRAGQRAALTAVERIGDRVLIGDLGLSIALNADAKARGVHHDEHGGKALVLVTHEVSGRAVIVEQAGGVAVDAHLLFDRTAGHAIARGRFAVFIENELGHDEERDALGAVRRSRGLGQHQMDDVAGQVMLASGNEDLGAGDRVAAIAVRYRLGADHAEIGAAMRLGQVHGARPFTRDHLGNVSRLLLVRTLGQDR